MNKTNIVLEEILVAYRRAVQIQFQFIEVTNCRWLDQATMEFRARASKAIFSTWSAADLQDRGRRETENDRLNGHSYVRGIEKCRVIGKY
jgi:hypothetical protein